MQLPGLGRYDAPDHWRAIDFISDLHLSSDHPRTFEAWAAYLDGTGADMVLMLGDLFEVWVGDDARHDGFEQRCAQVLQRAASRRALGFMAGNRDFLVGPALLEEASVSALHDPTLLTAWGRRVLLTHGDELCLADTDYQRFRQIVRSDAWRSDFLAKPLDERRRLARDMRDASERQKREHTGPWADVDAESAARWLCAAGATDMVHGHTHRPGSDEPAPGLRRHVLTDWDLDVAPPRAEVLRLTPDGFSRLPLASA